MRLKIEEAYAEMFEHKERVAKKDEPYFRPSNAPGCALKMYIDICKGRVSGFSEEETFAKDWYTGGGTIAHSSLQKWLGKGGKLLGDWKCACGNAKKFSTKNICKKCGSEMEYEELAMSLDGIEGHTDGILEFKLDGKKYHIIIDFKGTNAERIKRHKPLVPLYPYEKNMKQIGIYTYAFKQNPKLNVVGWALIYFSRDDPKTRLVCWKIFEDKDWKKAKKFFEKEAHQNKVWKKTLKDHKLSRLIEHKRCTTEEVYNKEVKNIFSPCPLAKVCFSAPGMLLRVLKEARDELLQTVNKKKKKTRGH